MINQIINQPKTDQKWKAIGSLIAGIISIIPILQALSSGGIPRGFVWVPKEMMLLGFFSIVGVILGIKGLKSTKKKFAIGGIVVSIFSLLVWIFILYVAWICYITMGC